MQIGERFQKQIGPAERKESRSKKGVSATGCRQPRGRLCRRRSLILPITKMSRTRRAPYGASRQRTRKAANSLPNQRKRRGRRTLVPSV